MSIWNKVKGAFVETDEKPVPKPKITPQPVVVQNIVQPVYTGVALSPESEEFRRQFKAILEEENKRNFPGNDYYEYVEMKNAMIGILQEPLRYSSAFQAWRVVGNQTKETLLSTGQKYLGLVDKEIKEFEAAFQMQYNQSVGNNDKLIEQKTKEIQSLSEQLAKLNTEVQLLKQKNLDSTAALTYKHDAFMAAGEAQRQEILTEIEKINQYIN
jgi:hypothetical protein